MWAIAMQSMQLLGAPQAVGDSLVDSVVSDNIPIFTEEEKFNEAVSSIVKRVEAKLTGGLLCASQPQAMLCMVLWH